MRAGRCRSLAILAFFPSSWLLTGATSSSSSRLSSLSLSSSSSSSSLSRSAFVPQWHHAPSLPLVPAPLDNAAHNAGRRRCSSSSSTTPTVARSALPPRGSGLYLPAPTTLSFGTGPPPRDARPPSTTVLVGKRKFLERFVRNRAALSDAVGFDVVDPGPVWAALGSVDGSKGTACTFVKSPIPVPVPAPADAAAAAATAAADGHHRISLCVLPDETSRYNHPMSVHTITEQLTKACPNKGNIHVVIGGVSRDVTAGPLASAVARAFPLYSMKTKEWDPAARASQLDQVGDDAQDVRTTFLDESGARARLDYVSMRAAQVAAEAVRFAARLVDAPPEELTTDAFAEECRRAVTGLGMGRVTMTEIVGDELRDLGYGGLYGVGKAATSPPRMIHLTYRPQFKPTDTVALVGKGIVYDTGGLSLKPKDGMAGMKRDMAGAAGALFGFLAAVQLGATQKMHLVLCLAENAIGPRAFRNDDILTIYSGKTVEINNCDAEGRLILADAVAHATRHFEGLDLVVDMATLTGAQLVATGKVHAGILANTAELERKAVNAGIYSGDLCFPLLYAPELLKSEFKSKVADMKNSVKDRMNAQSSCAGHFIESHLAPNYKGGWLHVDMAGPADKEERATGYGVGLILSLLDVPGF